MIVCCLATHLLPHYYLELQQNKQNACCFIPNETVWKKFSPEIYCMLLVISNLFTSHQLYIFLYDYLQYIPNAVVVKRCGGACLQHSCVSTDKRMVPFSVSMTELFLVALNYGLCTLVTVIIDEECLKQFYCERWKQSTVKIFSCAKHTNAEQIMSLKYHKKVNSTIKFVVAMSLSSCLYVILCF